MKRKKIMFMLFLFVAASIFFFSGCSTAELPSETEEVFTAAAKEVLPDYETPRAVTTWYLGDPIYEIFAIFADEPITYFNLYSLLNGADDRFTDMMNLGSAITDQHIDSPVDFGFNEDTSITFDTEYEYTGTEGSSVTYGKKDGVNYTMLNMGSYEDSEGESKSIIQAVYDETSGNILLGMFIANYVNDGDIDGWEKVIAFAEGNITTHLFKVKILRDGGAYDHNVIGYGISEGEGNYFLMKWANNTMDFSQAKYYTFDSSATTTELQAMDSDGSDAPENDTEGYDTYIQDTEPYTQAVLDAIDPDSLDLTVTLQ